VFVWDDDLPGKGPDRPCGAGVTEGDIHKLDSALIAAADRVSRHITATMEGRPVKRAEVVDLHARARA